MTLLPDYLILLFNRINLPRFCPKFQQKVPIAYETRVYTVELMSDCHEIDDIQLIKRAQTGDTEAYGELYERHAPSVFRFIYSHLDNYLDAEDLMGEVFLRVWQSLPNYKEKGVPFIAFLFRIARNGLVDHYRRNGNNKQQTSIDDLPIPDKAPEPGEAVIASLEHQEVRKILEQMREDYREVLILRFLSDLSPEETAEVMGRTPGAVRVLQHRALAAMRELLEG